VVNVVFENLIINPQSTTGDTASAFGKPLPDKKTYKKKKQS